MILLTGSNGFLGKYLIQNLPPNIVKTLNRSNSDYDVDLSINTPCFGGEFETVIHNAGKAHIIPISKEDIASFYNVNVLGTKNLLNGLTKSPPRRFVFISSVSVYGLNQGENINESSPLIASDPYGRSKIEAEDIIKKWCLENKVIYTILRLPLVAGPNPPGNLGSMISGIKNGYYFNISGGNSQKSMVLASDVAKFILKAAEVGGVYNLTDGCHPNFNELSRYIMSQLGGGDVPNMSMFFAKKLAFLGDKVWKKFPLNSDKLNKITSTLTFDDSKARKAFGWDPTPVLKGFMIQ